LAVDLEEDGQRLAERRHARCFQLMPEILAQPILKEPIGHAHGQSPIGQRQPRPAPEPEFVAIAAHFFGQCELQRRYDFPIAFGHFLDPWARSAGREPRLAKAQIPTTNCWQSE
jgi:hypothetical protein